MCVTAPWCPVSSHRPSGAPLFCLPATDRASPSWTGERVSVTHRLTLSSRMLNTNRLSVYHSGGALPQLFHRDVWLVCFLADDNKLCWCCKQLWTVLNFLLLQRTIKTHNSFNMNTVKWPGTVDRNKETTYQQVAIGMSFCVFVLESSFLKVRWILFFCFTWRRPLPAVASIFIDMEAEVQ